MTTDELKALLAGATPGPWEAVLDVFWRVYVADGGDYAGQCVGDMNESAAMWRSPSDEQPDDFAEANARLIALTPQLAAALIKAEEALASIAANTCCDGCQEAALVARAALSEIRALTGGNDD